MLFSVLIGVLIFSLNRKQDAGDSVITSKSSSSKVTSSESSTSVQSSKSSESRSSEGRITDVKQFNALSGSYQGNYGMMASLNFDSREVRTFLDNGNGDNIGDIDDVLQHSDGSLVIHAHFPDDDGTTAYYAYLFVPAYVSLEKIGRLVRP
jgi:hypothetical protein